MDEVLTTGLPAGSYCNIIDNCATTVTVGADSRAQIKINNYEEPILAICVGCSSDSWPTPGPGLTTTPSSGGPTTTTSPGGCTPPAGTSRTVIFIQKMTAPGQDMFIRGGIDDLVRPGCTQDAATSKCAIPISVRSLGTTTHYDKYNSWSAGDTKLDWYGAQPGQGSYMGQPASGTPLAWTTNVQTNAGYQALNKWGDHYWMLDVDMDCSQTEGGWFEVKAFLTNDATGWETDITQTTCTGTVGGTAPYSSKNHLGRCGHMNVFTFSGNGCQIDSL